MDKLKVPSNQSYQQTRVAKTKRTSLLCKRTKRTYSTDTTFIFKLKFKSKSNNFCNQLKIGNDAEKKLANAAKKLSSKSVSFLQSLIRDFS